MCIYRNKVQFALNLRESRAESLSSLRGKSQIRAKQSTLNRHTERSEVSKPRESKKIRESRIEKRINKSDSPLRHCDSYNFASSDLDSSLTLFAQNDEFGVDCFGDKTPRNDESSANLHKSTTKDTL